MSSTLSPPVDLEFLHASALGDDAFVRRLVGLLLEEMPNYMASLEQAVEKGDLNQVAFAIHRLKSLSRTAGMKRLDIVLGRLEAAVALGEVDRLSESMSRAMAAGLEAMGALKTWHATQP
jgi:HPt (histidine-containing phosphotransfer) domain-containing protein